MSGAAIVFMVLVTLFVWGGFISLVVRAVRREAIKQGGGDG